MPSQNLPPELYLLYLLSHTESFDSFEDDVGGFLTKSYSCLFEQFGLFNEVRKIPTWSRLGWLLFSAYIRFVQKPFELFGIIRELIELFISKIVRVMLALLDTLGVILEQLVAISIVVEDHLPENLDKMIIGIVITLFDGLELRLHEL